MRDEGAADSSSVAREATFDPALVERVGERILRGLKGGNDGRRAQGDELVAAVRAVIEAHADALRPLVAKQVLSRIPVKLLESRHLRGIPYPSVRTIQGHIAVVVQGSPHLAVKVFRRNAARVADP